MQRKVFDAVQETQDGWPLKKFFGPNLEPDDNALTKIEMYAKPDMGDLLNYMLVKLIGQVDDDTDLDELARDLEYASKELLKASAAVKELAEVPV